MLYVLTSNRKHEDKVNFNYRYGNEKLEENIDNQKEKDIEAEGSDSDKETPFNTLFQNKKKKNILKPGIKTEPKNNKEQNETANDQKEQQKEKVLIPKIYPGIKAKSNYHEPKVEIEVSSNNENADQIILNTQQPKINEEKPEIANNIQAPDNQIKSTEIKDNKFLEIISKVSWIDLLSKVVLPIYNEPILK